MQVVETFGRHVEAWSNTRPGRARKLLRTGWEAQNLKNRLWPDKRLLPADRELAAIMMDAMPYPVENQTCVHNRSVGGALPPEGAGFDELMDWYAAELLGQVPCMRMMDNTGRKRLFNDPGLRSIIAPCCPLSVCNEQKYGCRGGMYAARGRGRSPGRSGPWRTAPAGSRPRPTDCP